MEQPWDPTPGEQPALFGGVCVCVCKVEVEPSSPVDAMRSSGLNYVPRGCFFIPNRNRNGAGCKFEGEDASIGAALCCSNNGEQPLPSDSLKDQMKSGQTGTLPLSRKTNARKTLCKLHDGKETSRVPSIIHTCLRQRLWIGGTGECFPISDALFPRLDWLELGDLLLVR